MQTFDKLGYPVEIGDTVIYALGGRSDYSLSTGKVVDIDNYNKIYIKGLRRHRYCDSVINTKYLTPLDQVPNNNPELFL